MTEIVLKLEYVGNIATLKSAIKGLLNNQGHQELSINFILIPTKSTAEVPEYFNVDPNLNQVHLL
ncbi:5040_t:CDS:2 [Entrophospora sp. SA101]|nr:5040_t:CDS:2 [Entrophospora sp. SA101]